MKNNKERFAIGATIDVFEVGELRRLAAENKVEVRLKWEHGFTIEHIEWLNGYDPALANIATPGYAAPLCHKADSVNAVNQKVFAMCFTSARTLNTGEFWSTIDQHVTCAACLELIAEIERRNQYLNEAKSYSDKSHPGFWDVVTRNSVIPDKSLSPEQWIEHEWEAWEKYLMLKPTTTSSKCGAR